MVLTFYWSYFISRPRFDGSWGEWEWEWHCVKSVRNRCYSCPRFPTFGLNTERYGVSLRIQSECGKMQTRITPNINTLYALWYSSFQYLSFRIYLKSLCVVIKAIRTKYCISWQTEDWVEFFWHWFTVL